MQITKNRIRRNYEPLSVAVSVAVMSDGDSPLTQVYDEALGVYQPNRRLTPLVLMPKVTLTATDGSLAQPLTNRDIAADSMKWILDGKDITTVWKDVATVDTSDSDDRGMLTISTNIKPGEKHTLHFEATVADVRTGKNISVVSDDLIMATTDKSEDDWSVGMEGARTVVYDPTQDMLAEMEYEVAQGIVAAYSEEELAEAEQSAGSYRHCFRFDVKRGAKKGSGHVMKYYVMEDATHRTEVTDDNMEDWGVESYDDEHLTLDLRMVERQTLAAEVVYKNKVVAAVTFGAARKQPGVTWEYLNKMDARAEEDWREDRVMAATGQGALKYPSRTHNILWYVTDASGKDHQAGIGERVRYSTKEYGLKDTAEIAEYIATEQKPAHMVVTDKSGAVLTDNAGRTLVMTTVS